MRATLTSAAAGLLLLARDSAAISIDVSDTKSITDAAKTIAASVMSYYQGEESGGIPGLLDDPYYWWEAGLMFDSMVRYSALTGDDQYDDVISRALLFQTGPDDNYMPPNQSESLGNDDQASWALAAMSAAEMGFQAPPEDSDIDAWVDLPTAVFDSQVARWDNKTCGGGLRWQIYSFNSGYNYKNAMSNGDFMQLAARLYAFTGNETYMEWWNVAREWSEEVGLYEDGSVYDGTDSTQNCSELNHLQWTASTGTYLSSYVYMGRSGGHSDTTEISAMWSTIQKIFVRNGTAMQEIACEPSGTCNVDQFAFKSILAMALAALKDLVPGDLPNNLMRILQGSAKGAAAACSGSSNGNASASLRCGSDWTKGRNDGSSGLGQDLSALNIMLANLPSIEVANSTTNSTNDASGSDSDSSSGGASGEGSGDGEAPAEQTGENTADSHAASMFGLLGAVGFAVAFYL